jgi:hypothetical protein
MDEEKRKILIITDNTASMLNVAMNIAADLRKPPFSDYSVSTLEVAQFSAVDILPVYAFFIGCDNQKAFSFLYIEDLFAHINLAGRPCGIFSSNAIAIRYLTNLVRPCEAVVGKPFHIKDETVDSVALQRWIIDVVMQGDIDGRI